MEKRLVRLKKWLHLFFLFLPDFAKTIRQHWEYPPGFLRQKNRGLGFYSPTFILSFAVRRTASEWRARDVVRAHLVVTYYILV